MSMLLSLSLSVARTKKQKLEEVLYLKDEMILSSAYAPDRTMRLATRHTGGLFSLNFMGPRMRTGTVQGKADAEHVTK